MNWPNKWKEVELDAICQETEQWNPAREPRDKFYYIDVSSVSNDTFRIISPAMTPTAGAPGRARKIVHHRDVIFATIRPTLRRVALVPKEYDNQMASTAFCVIRIDQKEAVPEFVFYYLLTDKFNARIAEHQHGASYPAVTDKKVREQTIPLPDLPEQRKIATVLFRIQKAIELQEAIIERTRELKKAAMQFVFTHGLRGEKTKETEIGRMPESWKVVPLSQVYNLTKKSKELRLTSYNNIAFIPMELISKDGPYLKEYVLKKPAEISSGTYIENGDILVAKITPCFENGKQAIVRDFPNGFGMATTEVIPIHEKQDISDCYFLFYYLLKPDVRSLIAGKMEGATGRQRVPAHIIENLAIPFPPSLEEQKEIGMALVKIDGKISLNSAKKSALQALFKTMLNKLMSGEIRVKDLEIDDNEIIATNGGTKHD